MSTIVSILKAGMSLSCIVEFVEDQPLITISYGLSINQVGGGLQKTTTNRRSDTYATDLFEVKAIADSRDEVDGLISDVLSVIDGFEGDTTYSMLSGSVEDVPAEMDDSRQLFIKTFYIMCRKYFIRRAN